MEASKTEVLEQIDRSKAELIETFRRPTVEEIPAVIDEATRLLIDEFDPLQVILFGSQARGDAHEDSDIDLLIIVPDEIEGTRHELGCRGLEKIWHLPPIGIDLIVQRASIVNKHKDVPYSLFNKILSEGKVLYDRSQSKSKELAAIR